MVSFAFLCTPTNLLPKHGILDLSEEKWIDDGSSVEHMEVVLLVVTNEISAEENGQLPRHGVLQKNTPDAKYPIDLFTLFHPLFEAYKCNP